MKKIDRHSFRTAFAQAKSRIFFLDIDGTLCPISSKRIPQVSEKTKNALLLLSRDSRNQIVIISGRKREEVDSIAGDLPIVLVAEHGGFLREADGQWKARFPASLVWKPKVFSVLLELTQLHPGSMVEEKHYSICWHYRAIKDKISEVEINDVLTTLHLISKRSQSYIVHDQDTIEMRSYGIDKGRFAEQWLWGQKSFDFVVALGDSKTDEDLFEAIGPSSFTIKIGDKQQSCASYYLESQDQVESLLVDLVESIVGQ